MQTAAEPSAATDKHGVLQLGGKGEWASGRNLQSLSRSLGKAVRKGLFFNK